MTTTSSIYIPKIVRTPEEETVVRLGLQGWAGTGKTHSALTFPNPIVADFDNNLTPEQKKKFPSIPFWDANFVEKELKCPPTKPVLNPNPNRRDALINFLSGDATLLTKDQTLILDSWTAIQEAVDNQSEAEPVYNKEGSLDTYAFWNKKLKFSQRIFQLVRSLKCNIVVTFHEIAQRDPKSGALLDKIRPLQQGQFQAELQSKFTFFFRTLCEEEMRDNKVEKTKWFWQVGSNNQFDAIARPAFPDGVFKVEPHYDSIKKIMEIKK